jgi:hypothetical protein
VTDDLDDFTMVFDDLIRARGGHEAFTATGLAAARRYVRALLDESSSMTVLAQLEAMLPRPPGDGEDRRLVVHFVPSKHGQCATLDHILRCDDPLCVEALEQARAAGRRLQAISAPESSETPGDIEAHQQPSSAQPSDNVVGMPGGQRVRSERLAKHEKPVPLEETYQE